MKKFESPFHIGLITLLILSVLFAKIKAQPDVGLFTESRVSIQDNVTKNQEAKTLELLNVSLKSLSDRDLRNRRIGGYVMLSLGIGMGIGGTAVLAAGNSDDSRIVGYSLLGAGALLGGLSALPFKIRSESEHIYREFSDLPADNPDQIRQKFYYGERRFEELAQKKRKQRLISGCISIATGFSSLFFVDDTDETRIGAFTGPVIGGIMIFLIKSEEERRFETYQRAKEDIIGHNNGKKIFFGAAPLRGGGMLTTVQVRF